MGETRGAVGANAVEAASERPADPSPLSLTRTGTHSRGVVRELLERGRVNRDRHRKPSMVTSGMSAPAAASSVAPASSEAVSAAVASSGAAFAAAASSAGPSSEVPASSVRGDGSSANELVGEAPSPEAFLELFHEYERYVASIGKRILGSNNGVDDLVQEVFLVIYQEFHKLHGLSSIKAWLATIATRLAWRQRGRPWLFSKLSLAQVEELNPLESTDASPELQADLSVLLDRLRSMPVSLQEPWLLRFIDGETLPRIAELCDCSQSTVQRRLREASEVMLGTRRPESVSSD